MTNGAFFKGLTVCMHRLPGCQSAFFSYHIHNRRGNGKDAGLPEKYPQMFYFLRWHPSTGLRLISAINFLTGKEQTDIESTFAAGRRILGKGAETYSWHKSP
jgi:hypothetical protein